ncbi:uncharacterized protein LOC120718815 isoform X2 [Simochromis diagramma]|uniref:uncharacterized protein LOC120718815 isoform X2 n=1 Tax=Simochromis diagramma TaxID=43689 RepID=UPI001A7E7B59|nr:uncharacterized protein LOC120718815 isoform X2 [Simochromis diagramma]
MSTQSRSVKRLEEELNSVIQRLAEMGEKLCEANTVVKRHEEELNSVKESLTEVNTFYQLSLRKAGLAAMEQFYKEKLQEERSAHKETEEELKSFKDRVAGEVDIALQAGNSENMNNPVNETRLKEMYKELRKDWARIKPYLQKVHSTPERIKAWIQRSFLCGTGDMEQKKKLIELAFNLNADHAQASQKVHEYTNLTLHNLQLAFYHSFIDTAAQGFHGQEGEFMNNLLSKCRWLSGLFALNNPPLQPDWINHHPGQDAWNIFPQEITTDSAMSPFQGHSAKVLKCLSPLQRMNESGDLWNNAAEPCRSKRTPTQLVK